MSPKILLVAAAALTVSGIAAVPASAQTPPPPAPPQAQPGQPGKMPLRATIMFNLVDRNADGSIDKDELDVVRNAIFAAIDANADGKLSKDEVQAIGRGMGGPGPRPGFQRGPRFGWQGGPPRWQGGPRDWHGPHGGQRPQGQRQSMDDRQGPPPAGMAAPAGAPDEGPFAAPQDLAATDQNGDGAITREEFAVGMLPGMGELFGAR